MGEEITIIIKRDKYFMDKYRSYHVILNNNDIGSIDSGGEFLFTCHKSSHIKLKIDWCYSNTVMIDQVKPKSNKLELVASSNIKGWKMIFSIYYIIFSRRKYLILKEKYHFS